MSVNTKDYNNFIKNIKLVDIMADEFSFKRFNIQTDNVKKDLPAKITLKPTKDEYAAKDGGECDVFSSILFRIEQNKQKIFEVKVKFHLVYICKIHMNDEIFDIFSKRNIPLTIFPFLRELISNAMYRAGLPPFIVPLLKNDKRT